MPFLPLAALPHPHGLQLIATIGPSSIDRISALAEAGATAFRVNASHVDSTRLCESLKRIRAACPDAPVVVDLQGAKMRVDVTSPRAVRRGEPLTFGTGDVADVRVPHPELFSQAGPGDTLAVDDGRLAFEVLEARPGELLTRALRDGSVEPRKGINIVHHPIALAGLTPRDLETSRIGAGLGAEGLAFSFMADGREAAWLRREAPGLSVVGKVERREAVEHLDAIAAAVDAIWICRGDLGVQLGPAGLARFVAGLSPLRFEVPVLMAGQVLEHLTGHPAPTRTEVCHLFDLVARGYAGIVLSDETAIGRDPVHAVSTAAALVAAFRS